MTTSVKRKLSVMIPLMVFYAVFCYLPWVSWFGEWVFLIIKLVAFAVAAGILIFFKHKYKWEIERPHKELRYSFLLPLFLFCGINFLSVPFLNPSYSYEAEDLGLLFMESFADLASSVLEDVLFVDVFIALMLEILPFRYKRSLSILFSSLLFTAVHACLFLYPGEFTASDPIQVAIVQEVFVFLLTAGCGYLAIYYDSALIPVAFHFLYNLCNHVLYYHIYALELSWQYVLFISIFAVFAIFYFAALWHMSEAMVYRKNIKAPKESGQE